jgi:hypothetical protein
MESGISKASILAEIEGDHPNGTNAATVTESPSIASNPRIQP